MTNLASILLLLSAIIKGGLLLSCIDERGREVDYFVVYKLPKLENSSNLLIRSGYGYAYSSSNDKAKNMFASVRPINDTRSSIGATLKSIYKRKTGDNLLLYNDQPPSEYNSSSKSSAAHAKGIFASDSKQGFWLVHSVPRFPSILNGSYHYPLSGRNNGQVLICISFLVNDTETVANIGKHLLLIKPNIYFSSFTPSFLNQYPVFRNLLNKKRLKNDTLIKEIYTINRIKFTLFSKSRKYQKDIYSQLIAPFFKTDLLVQTWRNGAGEKLDSDCKDRFKIINIDNIKINNTSEWKYTEDHSKWLVSVDKTKSFNNSTFCLSDINRMKSQFTRGGGSLCIHSPTLWSIFSDSVENVEGCKTKKKTV